MAVASGTKQLKPTRPTKSLLILFFFSLFLKLLFLLQFVLSCHTHYINENEDALLSYFPNINFPYIELKFF